MKDKSFIKLEHIDTSKAAKNFSNLLHEKKNYFLNGAWGSGKTEFLNEVQEHTKRKLVNIDFWKLKDDRTVIELAFSKLHPLIYLVLRFGVVLAVVVSILMTNVVDLGIGRYFLGSWIKVFGSFIVLIVAVYQFFKIKSDDFYAWLLLQILLTNKVLVIDDFDRLSNNQQEEIYKLFSLLKGRLPIVFVGDISKINQVKDNYLSKIIDRRVELPFAVHPSSIWDSYFKQLEKNLNIVISQNFKQLVKDELRNLRDREHFNDYVNKEFFERGKLGHVQIGEQLLVIYVYLFHVDFYRDLLNNTIKDISAIYSKEKSKDSKDSSLASELVDVLFPARKKRLFMNNEYPRPFSKDKQAYFIYEEASNMTVEELEKLFSSEEELTKAMLLERDTDFYQYLTAEYLNFSSNRKEELLNLVLYYVKQSVNSPTIEYIIAEGWKPIKSSDDDKIFEFWDKILDVADFDFSQKLYLLQKYDIISLHDLGERFPDVAITGEAYNKARRKDFILFIYLSRQGLWTKFENWDNKIWNAINTLNDEQFINFWIYQRVLSITVRYDEYDFNPQARDYYLCTGRYEFDIPHKFRDYNTIVISKVSSRLEELKNKGYHFKSYDDEQYKLSN